MGDQFILNGGQVLTTYRKVIELGSSVLEYSGVDSVVEVINGSRPLDHPLTLMFLAVSALPRPDITFAYTQPTNTRARPSFRWGRRFNNCKTKCGGEF